MRKASLALLFLLGACATNDAAPRITAATPVSVTVWGSDFSCPGCGEPISEQRMSDLAIDHCATYGKVPRRVYENHYELGRTITFDCVAE